MTTYVVTVLEERKYAFEAENIKDAEKEARQRVRAPDKLVSLEPASDNQETGEPLDAA